MSPRTSTRSERTPPPRPRPSRVEPVSTSPVSPLNPPSTNLVNPTPSLTTSPPPHPLPPTLTPPTPSPRGLQKTRRRTTGSVPVPPKRHRTTPPSQRPRRRRTSNSLLVNPSPNSSSLGSPRRTRRSRWRSCSMSMRRREGLACRIARRPCMGSRCMRRWEETSMSRISIMRSRRVGSSMGVDYRGRLELD